MTTTAAAANTSVNGRMTRDLLSRILRTTYVGKRPIDTVFEPFHAHLPCFCTRNKTAIHEVSRTGVSVSKSPLDPSETKAFRITLTHTIDGRFFGEDNGMNLSRGTEIQGRQTCSRLHHNAEESQPLRQSVVGIAVVVVPLSLSFR